MGIRFQYDQAILERYPEVVGGVIVAQNVTNDHTPERLLTLYQAEQAAVKTRIGNTPLSQIAALSAWRNAFRGFGVDPTQYRSASEALLRRLTKKGDIPSINLLVDIGNLVSIRYALPVAVINTRSVHGPITVQFAHGGESITMHGESDEDQPEPGEVIFADAQGLVIARRWCWRQSMPSTAQLDTDEAIITVEAHHAQGQQDIKAALDDLQTLLHEFAGGTYTARILDTDHPSIAD